MVYGIQREIFRETEPAYGLLEDNNMTEQCLHEAVMFQMPKAMRQLFATLLVYSNPHDPKALFFKFEDAMSEDFVNKAGQSNNGMRNLVLQSIDPMLQSMGKKLAHFNLDEFCLSYHNADHIAKEIEDEMNISISKIDANAVYMLNKEQAAAYFQILDVVFSNRPTLFFVDGLGGTGKIFLYRTLLATVRGHGMLDLATTTSGVAASILPNGRTAHSCFKLPIDIE